MRGIFLVTILWTLAGVFPVAAQWSAERSRPPRNPGIGMGGGHSGGSSIGRSRNGASRMRRAGGRRRGSRSSKSKQKVRAENSTVSVADLQAPKKARKAYDKGRQQLSKGEFTKARASFEKAVREYPNYPSAWYQLGRLYARERRTDEAKTAYGKAVEADPKMWRAYAGLARYAASEENWPELAETTDRAIAAMPLAFSRLYVYNAVAKFALRDFEAAETSALEAIERSGGWPSAKAYHVLGLVQALRGEYDKASVNLRRYLTLVPDAEDALMVREQLALITDPPPAALP